MNYSIGGAVWRGDADRHLRRRRARGLARHQPVPVLDLGRQERQRRRRVLLQRLRPIRWVLLTDCLAENPELLKRIARGELFNLGQHYLA